MQEETLRCMAHGCNGNLVRISASCCSEVYQCQKCGRRMRMDRNRTTQGVYTGRVIYPPYNPPHP